MLQVSFIRRLTIHIYQRFCLIEFIHLIELDVPFRDRDDLGQMIPEFHSGLLGYFQCKPFRELVQLKKT